MINSSLLSSVLIGVSVLIFLILKFKIQPFLGLLISSILVGILAGIAPSEIMSTVKEGMGSTLGFVAVVVGLGAMFGAILGCTFWHCMKWAQTTQTGWKLRKTKTQMACP